VYDCFCQKEKSCAAYAGLKGMEGSAVLGLANSTHCLEVLGILEQIIYSIQKRRKKQWRMKEGKQWPRNKSCSFY
jgi:hypothetical protein